MRNGAWMPQWAVSLTVVSALIAVPPMPMPKMPIARPRRAGGNHALTNGTPTANDVPASPRKKPPISTAGRELWPTRPRNRTGTIVANEMTGNISRPPYRSVRAPTGIRPSAPTITGTATIRACWKLVSPSASLTCAPSGDSSAQAQNVSANPTVAMPSMTYGRRPAAVSPAVPGRLTIVAMAHPSLDRRQAAARRPRIPPRFALHTGGPEGTNDPTGPPFGPQLTMGAGVSSRWLSVTGFKSPEPIMTPDAVGGAAISHHDIAVPMPPADIRLAQRKPAPTRRRTGIRRLSPGYFALVMATGIVSVAVVCAAQPVPGRSGSRGAAWLPCGEPPGLVHADGHHEPGNGGEGGDYPDRREDPERVRDQAGQQRANGEPAVAPQPVHTYRTRTPGRMRNVAHGGEQGRVDHRGADAEQHGSHRPHGERGAEGDQGDRARLHSHPGSDEPFAADPVRQRAGAELPGTPDRRVEGGEYADLAHGKAVPGEQDRE